MSDFDSPMTHLSHSPPSEPGPVTASIQKYLDKIPGRFKTGADRLKADSYMAEGIDCQRPTQETHLGTLESTHELPELRGPQSWRDLYPPVLPIPSIRIKGPTVLERAAIIVAAADDCGRLHSERAKTVYAFLVTAAITQHVTLRPTVTVTPNRLTFFFVVDELSILLNVSRATIYRAFDDLQASGLVARRPWYTSSRLKRGGTVTGGVVADVVLSPGQGTEARVRAEYLQQNYRNLDADRYAGRTAWKWMTQVKETEAQAQALEKQADDMIQDASSIRQINALRTRAEEVRQSILSNEIGKQLNHLLRWTLSSPDLTPVTLTVSARQEAVYRLGDLSVATPQQRQAMIDERARALCIAAGDQGHNVNFWRWLLWRMIELEYSQPGTISSLSTLLLRLLTDRQEWEEDRTARRPLKKPAGLFIARLKATGWWDALKAVKAA